MGLVVKSKLVTVTTAGTPVPVLGATDAQSDIVICIIQARTNTIYVGDSTVLASSSIGHKLVASTNDSMRLDSDAKNSFDLAKVYLDASANSSTANVTYFVRV